MNEIRILIGTVMIFGLGGILFHLRNARLTRESKAILNQLPYADGIVFLNRNYPTIARNDTTEIGVSGK